MSRHPGFRRGLSGLIAGFVGGCVLVIFLLLLDIAHLRSLALATDAPPGMGEWLRVPVAFALLGMALALVAGDDG